MCRSRNGEGVRKKFSQKHSLRSIFLLFWIKSASEMEEDEREKSSHHRHRVKHKRRTAFSFALELLQNSMCHYKLVTETLFGIAMSADVTSTVMWPKLSVFVIGRKEKSVPTILDSKQKFWCIQGITKGSEERRNVEKLLPCRENFNESCTLSKFCVFCHGNVATVTVEVHL